MKTVGTISLRQKLHQFVDQIEDKKVKAIYALLKDALNSSDSELEEPKGEYSSEFKGVLDSRVENYKNGAETVSPEDMSKRIEAIRKTGKKYAL